MTNYATSQPVQPIQHIPQTLQPQFKANTTGAATITIMKLAKLPSIASGLL